MSFSDAWGGAWGTPSAWATSWQAGTAAPPPVYPAPQPYNPQPPTAGLAGGMSYGPKEYRIEFQKEPEQKLFTFSRNMESQDRRDVEDIIDILMKNGVL